MRGRGGGQRRVEKSNDLREVNKRGVNKKKRRIIMKGKYMKGGEEEHNYEKEKNEDEMRGNLTMRREKEKKDGRRC